MGSLSEMRYGMLEISKNRPKLVISSTLDRIRTFGALQSLSLCFWNLYRSLTNCIQCNLALHVSAALAVICQISFTVLGVVRALRARIAPDFVSDAAALAQIYSQKHNSPVAASSRWS